MGRKKIDYETTVIRVPIELAAQVTELIGLYRLNKRLEKFKTPENANANATRK